MYLLRILDDEIVGGRQLCSFGRSTTTRRVKMTFFLNEKKLTESFIKHLSNTPTKWSNTLKQFVGC